MAQDTDQLNWTLPTPGEEEEAGLWAQILIDAIDDEIEPDVVEAQQSVTSVPHADESDYADQAGSADTADKVVFSDGTSREFQINGSDEQGVVNFKT